MVEDNLFGMKSVKISDLVESLLQAGCHLASLLLLRAEHRVAPQLLLHLAALVPEQKCESLKGKDMRNAWKIPVYPAEDPGVGWVGSAVGHPGRLKVKQENPTGQFLPM